ncbi:MAG: type III pantothenate kinase [Spirosomataceae bacterium]
MFLAFDIGNSDITVGVHHDGQWKHLFRIVTHLSSRAGDYEAQLRLLFLENNLKISEVVQVVVSSVVPEKTGIVKDLILQLFGKEPIVVGPTVYPHLKLEIVSPHEIGTDLVANAVYAYHTYHQDCIVVDFGTALTFTIVSGEGKILGVSIAPGLKTAVKSLFANTAQLPEVPLQMPESAIGQNTVHAIQAGVLWGYVGLVEKMIERIKMEIGMPHKVLATGGLSSILTPLRYQFDEVDVNLTMNGLKIIAELVEKNRGRFNG